MSIQEILAQIETTFGRPSATVLFNNNAMFASAFNPMDTPETLFHRIEECQEVAVLGGTPYTNTSGVDGRELVASNCPHSRDWCDCYWMI